MTSGPEPITSTEWIPVLLGTVRPLPARVGRLPRARTAVPLPSGALSHQFDEALEQRGGVVRAGRRLRVELHAERRDVEAAQALDDVVVEADVADLHRPVGGLGRPVE